MDGMADSTTAQATSGRRAAPSQLTAGVVTGRKEGKRDWTGFSRYGLTALLLLLSCFSNTASFVLVAKEVFLLLILSCFGSVWFCFGSFLFACLFTLICFLMWWGACCG